jgi:hypothetical protein
MEDKKKDLMDFLEYILKDCCDEYGHVQILSMKKLSEQMKKEYFSETVEGVVDEWIKNKK